MQKKISITKELVKAASGATNDAAVEKIYPYLKTAMERGNITTPARVLSFLSQVGTESAGLARTEEFASGADYEGRQSLGNTQPGDGVKFKGRGPIQITGRYNYTQLSNDTGIDFVKNPALLAADWTVNATPTQLKNSAMSAVWFWNKHNLNALADQINMAEPISGNNLAIYRQIGAKINGKNPPNGDMDRLSRLSNGLQYYTSHKNEVDKTSIPVPAIIGGSVLVIGIGFLSYYLYKKYKK